MISLEHLSIAVSTLAFQEVEAKHAKESNADKSELYPQLSQNLKALKAAKPTAPKWFSQKLKNSLKEITKSEIVVKNGRIGGFSDYWRGLRAEVANVNKSLSPLQRYEQLLYQQGAEFGLNGGISKALFAENFPEVDLALSEEWCVSLNGENIIAADDYYSGNFAEFKEAHDKAISQAEGEHKRKLIAQLQNAESRLLKSDISQLEFSINSTLFDLQTKCNFLNQHMRDFDGLFAVGQTDGGKWRIEFKVCSDKSDPQERKDKIAALKRLALYASGSTGFTSGKKGEEDKRVRKELKTYLRLANAQFTSWVQADSVMMSRINDKVNDPNGLQFKSTENGEPIQIEGIKESFKPRAHQAAFVRQQSRKMGGILGFDVGLGKAQPLDAKILTPSGWKMMGEMQVGQEVIAYDGVISKVIGVYPQGKKSIFKVTFSDGSSTKCCDEHLWLTQTENDRKKERYARKKGENRIEKGSVKPLSEIRGSLIYQTQKNHKIPLVSCVNFPEKAFGVDPYLMGVLLGDGCLRGTSVSLCTPDKSIIERVQAIVERDFREKIYIYTQKSEKRETSYRFSKFPTLASNPLHDELHKYGLMGKLSQEKFIPQDYLFGSLSQRIDLLNGLMDTDGYVSKDGITIQFYSTSEQLANNVIELVQSLGGIAWKNVKLGYYKNEHGEKVQCLDCMVVSMRMPASINPFYLPRKAERVKPKTKYQAARYVVSVEECGEQEAQCIAIDHPEHLYVTDDYIVTHNTFSALLAVQHLQSISVKNKTIFIVPSSTFTNWKKEAEAIYTDDVMARCLFVGLSTDKNGEATYKSSEVVTDLAKIVENKHDKLFMTYEGFKAISLGDQTIEDYLRYLQEVDETLQFSDKNKENEQIKSDAEKLKKRLIKDMKGKLLETMGVDSLVIDEAHNFKNGKTADFGSRIRYMSTVNEASARALDTLIKSWYIRNENKQKHGKSDGVLALTATPVTNSPLEIYSMLSLAVGEQEVNRLCGVNGPDQFLEMFCLIDAREERSVDDLDIEIECFTGLRNIDLLRKLMNSVATMKSADDLPDKQGYSIPDEETIVSSVPLSDEIKQNLGQLKLRYQIGKMIAKGKDIPPHLQMAAVEVEQYAKEIGLPVETLGHAFNFISRQSKSILDKDLSDETSRFYVQKKQADLARQVVEAFNKKPLVDRGRTNLIGVTDEPYKYDVKASKANADGEVIVESKDVYNVTVLAKFEEETGLIHFNSVSYEAQTKLRELAEKYGLDLDVSLSPKLSALLDNVKAELANPQAKGGIAKQIIFTEELGMHQKIKQALIAKCGIPSGKIAIINAQAIPDNADLQAVQDGFNTDDDGENQNRYQIVIANKKAEVGINLQKGTQAIHHLDINWTPDSIQQRNGRGVRQGNYLAKEGIKVRVYHYDVKGTFDSYKRNVVNQKADWIGSLLYGESNRILASQDTLSVQQQAELAELTGDEEAMATKMAEILEENRQKAVKSAREDVLLSYQQMEVARIALTNLQSFENYLTPLFAAYTDDVKSYADYTLAKVRKIQGEITDEKAKLQSDEKGSPTYNKRLKTLEVLQEKLDKAEGNARKTWAVVVHKYAKLDERLSTADVPLDQDAARNFLTISEVKQAAVEAGENHTLFEQYENDRAVKEQMMQRYQTNIERKQEETGIDMERLRHGSKVFLVNGLPLCEGDFIKISGKVSLVSHFNESVLFTYPVQEGDSWNKRSETYYDRLGRDDLNQIELVINKGSAQAYEIYPQLAALDRGEEVSQRWGQIVPQVREFADENELIPLNHTNGACDRLKIGYLLIKDELNQLEELMPELAADVIKDYAENGIFRDENGALSVKAGFDLSEIYSGERSEKYISDYALKHGYTLSKNFSPIYSRDTPSFSDLHKMGFFEKPEYDLTDCISKMKAAITESSNPAEKTTALRKICQQTLIDLGITDEALAELIVSNYRNYRLASKYDNVFIRLSHLYADALNGVGVFAETEIETVSNSESSTPASGQILPDFYIITGDTSRGGYDNFRDKVEGAIKNAGISHLTKWTGVLWVTDHTLESFKSTILPFWKQHGQKEIISANVARNQWIIHKDVWDALLNYDPQGLKQHGISVRTV